MKFLFVISLFLLSFSAKAQNLITDPSFAVLDTCPYMLGQMSCSKYWYPTTIATTDLWGCTYGIPNGYCGRQLPHAGAMAGIITYKTWDDYREYVSTDIPALEINKHYKVTIRVSRSEYYGMASDGLGVYFYDKAKPDSEAWHRINYSPQIDYSGYGIITDTVNWVILTDTFMADSAYKHLAIGTFRKNDSMHILGLEGIYNAWDSIGYYFIDSAAVEKVDVPISHAGIGVPPTGNVAIHPNPSHSTLTVSAPHNFRHITVCDLTGRQIFNAQCDDRSFNIDVSGFPKGIYVVRVDEACVLRFVKD